MHEAEWEAYLDYRKAQNFNVVQISILPVLHDRTDQALVFEPFLTGTHGRWDTTRLNKPYFERAARMVKTAMEKGFTVWCCCGASMCRETGCRSFRPVF